MYIVDIYLALCHNIVKKYSNTPIIFIPTQQQQQQQGHKNNVSLMLLNLSVGNTQYILTANI